MASLSRRKSVKKGHFIKYASYDKRVTAKIKSSLRTIRLIENWNERTRPVAKNEIEIDIQTWWGIKLFPIHFAHRPSPQIHTHTWENEEKKTALLYWWKLYVFMFAFDPSKNIQHFQWENGLSQTNTHTVINLEKKPLNFYSRNKYERVHIWPFSDGAHKKNA